MKSVTVTDQNKHQITADKRQGTGTGKVHSKTGQEGPEGE